MLAALRFFRLLSTRTRDREGAAGATREVKCGTGHLLCTSAGPDVTPPEDRRRDFRINAIAEIPPGRLHDPYLAASTISANAASARLPAFVEDPLR
ncbi:MAG: hypothetical protein H6982_16475 [Chromatiales bacterium]|nr:hypothetical protein [Chromatiales bacterium]